jgi:CubicO group peptidase (beta-lactamase class C family)
MNLVFRLIIVILILFPFGSQNRVVAQDTIDIKAIEKKIDKYMTYFSGENPGAVVSVMKRGDIIFNRAFGLANVETEKRMSVDMVFNIENISKSFTSLAIMKLVEKGKLDLDNSLVDIFQDFPDYGEKVKIKYLLNHTSGLVSFNSDSLNSNDDVIRFLKNQDQTYFESGSKFKYSNSEYVVLAKIIEEVSKLSYQEFMNKYIFKKLKINSPFFNTTNHTNSNLAIGHFKENNEYLPKMKFSQIYGEQGIFMSADDFAKWDKALYTNQLLSCEYLTKIFTANIIDEKRPNYYGSGWVLMERNKTRYYWHGGGGTGYTTLVLHLPDTDVTVLILTNRNDGYDFLKMSINIAKLFDENLKL